MQKKGLVSTILSFFVVSGSFVLAQAPAKKIKIGFAMDTLKEERWQKDRDIFVSKAKSLGAEVLVQAANGNDALQASQAENLITQGVNVLVVVPHDSVTAGAIVKSAHKAGVKVLSYDRLIKNVDVDLYVSFDNVEVGRMQASYLVKKAPKGNYVMIGGSPTDNNAKLYHQGQLEILQPLISKGDIKVVVDQMAKEWQASEALKHTENALTKEKNNVQAVIATNDGLAGGVISALKQQKLEGKVFVSGQDADLAACQRVVEGNQSMTVYKPIKQLAEKAAELAFMMASNTPIKEATRTIPNGSAKEIPSVLMTPIAVDQANMITTVLKDKFHPVAQVYKNVPKNMWPKL